jgi:hypothetical protein
MSAVCGKPELVRSSRPAWQILVGDFLTALFSPMEALDGAAISRYHASTIEYVGRREPSNKTKNLFSARGFFGDN